MDEKIEIKKSDNVEILFYRNNNDLFIAAKKIEGRINKYTPYMNKPTPGYDYDYTKDFLGNKYFLKEIQKDLVFSKNEILTLKSDKVKVYFLNINYICELFSSDSMLCSITLKMLFREIFD